MRVSTSTAGLFPDILCSFEAGIADTIRSLKKNILKIDNFQNTLFK